MKLAGWPLLLFLRVPFPLFLTVLVPTVHAAPPAPTPTLEAPRSAMPAPRYLLGAPRAAVVFQATLPAACSGTGLVADNLLTQLWLWRDGQYELVHRDFDSSWSRIDLLPGAYHLELLEAYAGQSAYVPGGEGGISFRIEPGHTAKVRLRLTSPCVDQGIVGGSSASSPSPGDPEGPGPAAATHGPRADAHFSVELSPGIVGTQGRRMNPEVDGWLAALAPEDRGWTNGHDAATRIDGLEGVAEHVDPGEELCEGGSGASRDEAAESSSPPPESQARPSERPGSPPPAARSESQARPAQRTVQPPPAARSESQARPAERSVPPPPAARSESQARPAERSVPPPPAVRSESQVRPAQRQVSPPAESRSGGSSSPAKSSGGRSSPTSPLEHARAPAWLPSPRPRFPHPFLTWWLTHWSGPPPLYIHLSLAWTYLQPVILFETVYVVGGLYAGPEYDARPRIVEIDVPAPDEPAGVVRVTFDRPLDPFYFDPDTLQIVTGDGLRVGGGVFSIDGATGAVYHPLRSLPPGAYQAIVFGELMYDTLGSSPGVNVMKPFRIETGRSPEAESP